MWGDADQPMEYTMNNRPLGIGDFLIELKEATFKGDVPGHEFHGNQYSDGGGSSGGSESSGNSGSSGSGESWKTGSGRAKSAVRVNGHPVRGKMTSEHVAHEVDKPSGLTMSHSGGSFNFYRHSSGKVAVRGRGGELTDEQHIADAINNRTGL